VQFPIEMLKLARTSRVSIFGCRMQATSSIDDPSMAKKRREMLDRIIRVDHAGEVGADKIYAGQMFMLGKSEVGPLIQHMWDQEKEHLATFERLIPQYRARPTVFLPLWNVAGFVLGATTAAMGKEAAMACTEAVEEVIGEHYNNQMRELMADDVEKHKELLNTLQKIRDDEMEHHDTALEEGAAKAPFYSALKQDIQFGCRRAIWVAERF